MKQYSFASRLKSLALVFGIALAFASCANEDIAQNPNGTDNNKNFTIFSTGAPYNSHIHGKLWRFLLGGRR